MNNMPYASFLDPSILNYMTIESILEDIEDLVEQKKRKVEDAFNEFKKKHKSEKNEEWYLWQEDRFSDEVFIVDELESNLLNGLAVTVNTIFERHVGFFVREISKKELSIKFNDKYTYKMKDIRKYLNKLKHPNRELFSEDLFDKLSNYTDIRNSIVHQEGTIDSKDNIKSFVSQNKDLFNIKNQQLWIVSVKGEYIRQVLKDHKRFFKLLLYKNNGDILYY